eukprot:scaffold81063_cov33-Tisochrysis_lutea.AAC.2
MTTGAGMEAKGGASGGGKGAGGQFLKGAGESQLEADRRLYRKQISRVEAELEQVRRRVHLSFRQRTETGANMTAAHCSCQERHTRSAYHMPRCTLRPPPPAFLGHTQAGARHT